MNLEDLKKLCYEATPGPWERVAYSKSDVGLCMILTGGDGGVEAEANARFIVAARTHMTLLLERIQLLERVADEAESIAHGFDETCGKFPELEKALVAYRSANVEYGK